MLSARVIGVDFVWASGSAQAGDMDTIALGNVEITRVVELPIKGSTRDYIFPDVPVEHWQAHKNWLAPTFCSMRATVCALSARHIDSYSAV